MGLTSEKGKLSEKIRGFEVLAAQKKRTNRKVRKFFQEILKEYDGDLTVENQMIVILSKYSHRHKLAKKLKKEIEERNNPRRQTALQIQPSLIG